MKKRSNNDVLNQALRIAFAMPALLVLMAVEALTRRPALAFCTVSPLAGVPVWDDAPEAANAFAPVAEGSTADTPGVDCLTAPLDLPAYPSLPALSGEEIHDPEPITAPLPRPVPMSSAAQMTRPESLEEIGWTDPILVTVASLPLADLSAMDQAVRLVQGGMPTRKAARECGVAESSLRRRAKRLKATV